jgi:hypothetical protein
VFLLDSADDENLAHWLNKNSFRVGIQYRDAAGQFLTAENDGKENLCIYNYKSECMDFSFRDGRTGGIRGFSEFDQSKYPYRGITTYDEQIIENIGDKVCLWVPECGIG